MMSRRLYFVRHGLREDFQNAGWQASADNPWDPPLSADGRKQALDVGNWFADKAIEVVFSSPFLRTLETAQAVSAACGAPIRMEEALCEWLNPEWHNLPPRWSTPTEAASLFSGVDEAYVSKGRAVYPEAGEGQEVRARCQGFLERLLSEQAPGDVVFVSHGSCLGQCMDILLGTMEGVDFRMAAITEVSQTGNNFSLVHSGCGHLRLLDDIHRFI